MEKILYILFPILAYILGSISSAVWVSRRHGIDIREHGSKNAGATNVLRVLGTRAALPVFAFDFLKGLIAVSLIYLMDISKLESPELFISFKIILGVCAVLGHVLPVFYKFKGGKGVATIAGALVAISLVPMLIALLSFTITLIVTRYVSLGSVIAAIIYPILIVCILPCFEKVPVILKIFSIVVSVFLIFTHRANIARLIKGTENKTYFKKK